MFQKICWLVSSAATSPHDKIYSFLRNIIGKKENFLLFILNYVKFSYQGKVEGARHQEGIKKLTGWGQPGQ
jgi:hypothetical protein